MGRKLKRKIDQMKNHEQKKNSVTMTYQELNMMKQKVAKEQNDFTVDNLFMLFALAEHRVHKFGSGRIFKTLNYIEKLMEPIIKGELTFNDYAAQLDEETGIKVK